MSLCVDRQLQVPPRPLRLQARLADRERAGGGPLRGQRYGRGPAQKGPSDASRVLAEESQNVLTVTVMFYSFLPECRRGELRGEQRRGGSPLQVFHLQELLQEPRHHQVSHAVEIRISSRRLQPSGADIVKTPLRPALRVPGADTTSARPAHCSTTASRSGATCATPRPTASSTRLKVGHASNTSGGGGGVGPAGGPDACPRWFQS